MGNYKPSVSEGVQNEKKLKTGTYSLPAPPVNAAREGAHLDLLSRRFLRLMPGEGDAI